MYSRGAALMILGLLTALLATRVGLVGEMFLLWTAAAFIAVGLAYLFNRAGVFGKRPTGDLSAAHVLLLAPFLGLTWAAWHLTQWRSREPPISALTAHLRLARRLLAHELPADVDLVIDLTAEFPTRLRPPRYLNLRILDGGVPDRAELRRALDAVPRTGVVLVHCAQGHGRTALFTACLLVDRDGLDEHAAVAAILAARPLADLNRHQRAFLAAFAATSRSPAHARV